MTTANVAEGSDPVEAIIEYLSQGGELKTLYGIGEDELEAIYAVAYNHFTAGKYDKAVTLFKFLALQDHMNPRWTLGLGTVQQKSGNFAAAVDAYALATILDIDDPNPQAQAGYCLMAMEKWPEAKAALEGAIMVCKEHPGHDDVLAQAETLLATVEKRLADNERSAK